MRPRFILLDHSLKDLGGHHYSYAQSVLQAAEQAGFTPVLATHRNFRQRAAFDARWAVHPVFAHASYSRYTLDKQALSPRQQFSPPQGLWQRLRRRYINWRRERIAQAFAEGCARLFASVPLQPDDHVFVATASELDLAGLAKFLRHGDAPASGRWHLQFHFGIFKGRDPDYAPQAAAGLAMRESLATALHGLDHLRLSFYCTTEALTRQYQLLNVARFATLPYPVHQLFSTPQPLRLTPRPARIACLGHSRREKGYSHLPQLLGGLREYLNTGRARLVLQTRNATDCERLAAAARLDLAAIEPAPAGLDLQHYAGLVRGSDIGVLLYSGERYYDRCSGVLLEMLVAGVPVVVPAASWLSEQIAASNQDWLAELEALGGIAHSVPNLTAPRQPVQTMHEFGGGNENLLLRFSWRAPRQPGYFLRLQLLQQTAAGTLRTEHIVGPAPGDATIRLLLRLHPGCRQASLSWSNAFHDTPLELEAISMTEIPGPALPLGAVGLTIADSSHAADATRDILDHIAHYRRRTAAFAAHCARSHNAAAVVAQLVDTQQEPA